MSLVDAIDALLGSVPEDPPLWNSDSDLCNQFDELDRRVWVEARRLGLESGLPEEPSGDWVGKTHLPGIFGLGWFQPMAGRWRGELLALRELAASAAPVSTALADAVPQDDAPDAEWSEPKSPAEWQKELGKSSRSTWLRDIRKGNLVVDRSLGVKRVRISLDSLAKYKASNK